MLAAVYNSCNIVGKEEDVAKVAKELGVSLNLVISYSELIRNKVSIAKKLYVQDYIRKAGESLSLPVDLLEKAVKFGDSAVANKAELGKHPAVFAGAIIYMIANANHHKINQAKLAASLNVSERSIRRITKGQSLKL